MEANKSSIRVGNFEDANSALPKLAGHKKLHTAKRMGYVSRKKPDGIVVPYNGRYGTGYVHLTPRFDTTRFCNVTYYVSK